MSVNELYACERPFKLIALLCVFLALCLDVATLVSPAWVTAEKYALSLWESCTDNTAVWTCVSILTSEQKSSELLKQNKLVSRLDPAHDSPSFVTHMF
ncbi:transmembrane protein 47-like [Tachysurus ichikawai]